MISQKELVDEEWAQRKNSVCIRDSSPNQYKGRHKVFRENLFRYSGRQLHGLIHTKIKRFWAVYTK